MSNVLRLRTRTGLTQAQLAERLGVHPVTVCRWETGESLPYKKHLVAMAKLFNCSMADLFRTDQTQTG